MSRRPCTDCGKQRQARFFVSDRGRVCTDCQKRKRREADRRRHVASTYGLTPGDHARLLEHQGGRCAICKGERRYALNVDHDHATGLVRGLLCRRCNKLLRDVRDSSGVLQRGVDYLFEPPARQLGIEAVAR